MKRKSRVQHGNSRRLIQPLEAYILLPDKLSSVDVGNVKYTPCMTDLLIKTVESSRWLIDTELIPVHWLTLKLEPQKMVSVVAAVLPMINCRLRWFEINHVNKKRFFRYQNNASSATSMIETLPCVQQWDFDQLVNLQAIVVMHWPDPASELFERCKFRVPNAYTIRKALRQQKSITLGVPTHIHGKFYVDLKSISAPDRYIIFQTNRFSLSTAELALALMAALSRGVLKDCNAVYSQWLQMLVKPDCIIPTVHIPDPNGATTSTYDTTKVNRCSVSAAHVVGTNSKCTTPQSSKMDRPEKDKLPSPCFYPSVTSRPRQLKGARLGLVGLSSELPNKIAQLAYSAIGMDVSYYQKHPIPNVPYTHYENLKDLLQAADFVILADDSLNQLVSTNPRTKSPNRRGVLKHRRKPEVWLSYEHFVCLQPHALLICVTSIQCIDFVALSLALRYGQLLGASVTMPIVWFTQLPDLEALRQLPNTFILPPATSSVCAHSDVRLQVAQEALEIVANVLCRPGNLAEELDSHCLAANTANSGSGLLSTWDSEFSLVRCPHSIWPNTCGWTNDSNMHISSMESTHSSFTSTYSLSSSWLGTVVKNGGRVLEALACLGKR